MTEGLHGGSNYIIKRKIVKRSVISHIRFIREYSSATVKALLSHPEVPI